MATLEPYKDIFISQPTGEGGLLIQNNFKKLADDNYEKTTQIANITANYSLKTETQVVANNLAAEIITRTAGDNTVQGNLESAVTIIDSTITNVSGGIQSQIDQLHINFSSIVISGASISGDNLYLSGNAYSLGERLARISEVSNRNNSQISYDATDLSNVIAPSGNIDLLIIKNCVNPLTFGTPVNMYNGQTVKIILEPISAGNAMTVTLPVSGYSSITQNAFNIIWTSAPSAGQKPAAAMFEYTKLTSKNLTKICSVNYTSLESI